MASRAAKRYQWVIVPLAVWVGIALLLFANALRDYRFVSRLLAVQQVRHEMAQIASEVDQQFHRSGVTGKHLEGLLEQNTHGTESVSLRSADGALLEHTGVEMPGFPFTVSEELHAFSQRELLYKIVNTGKGEVVFEVYPIHPPPGRDGSGPAAGPSAEGRPHRPPLFILEVAEPLKEADATTLLSIRRNLAINLTAALSLLATVAVVAFGLRAFAKGKRLEEQLELARQVQARLLPGGAMNFPGVAVATLYKPAEQVGGDFYDVYDAGEGAVAALIGDVSGKGLPSALLMGVIHGAVKTAHWQGSKSEQETESSRLNRLIFERADGNRFASMFWCVYDREDRSLRYVNAGHPPPFLVRRCGEAVSTTRLREGGPVLGVLAEAAYTSTAVSIEKGDLLVLYSDGLVEAADGQGHEYGDERLDALLCRHFDETPQQLRDRIVSAWETFSAAGHAQDDLTIALLRF